MRYPRLAEVLSAIAALAASTAYAVPVTSPTGLNPGDQYRLVFVTSAPHDATSTDIADYNAFVTSVANGVPALASLGTTWSAIGSTATIDARDNTSTNPTVATGAPVYNLDDIRVADDNVDLWDGSLLSAIQYDETGTALAAIVHTGTSPSGLGVSGSTLGLGLITDGDSTATGNLWVTDAGTDNPYFETSYYAISGVLTVVPEPSAWLLASFGLVSLVVRHVRSWHGRKR